MNDARPLSEMEDEIHARLEAGKHSEAFELLMSHFQNKVFHLAYSMLGNEALAEETSQDVFVRIWRALDNYRGQSSLSTWIYAIARHTRVDHYRKARRVEDREQQVDVLPERPSSPAPESRGPDLEAMLRELPESQREVILMLKMAEMSVEEVARATSSSVGSVKQKAHRAYEKLRGLV